MTVVLCGATSVNAMKKKMNFSRLETKTMNNNRVQSAIYMFKVWQYSQDICIWPSSRNYFKKKS